MPAPLLGKRTVTFDTEIKWTPGEGARIARAVACRYRKMMADYASLRTLEVWYDRIDLQHYQDRSADARQRRAIRKHVGHRIAVQRRKEQPDYLMPKLATLEGGMPRIKEEPPLLFHPTVELMPELATGFKESGRLYRESLPDNVRTLFQRFRLVDHAIKVVGVGSVGTLCAVGLFMANDNDPLFLQIKEARASVLEPHAGKSQYVNHGQRVVEGQRLMQAASDVFLGWTRGRSGRHLYVRQLRDLKISPDIDLMDATLLRLYGHMCAHALARAHARSGDATAISGYLGTGRVFDEAIAEFAQSYAAQNQADYAQFIDAIQKGLIPAELDR